MKTKKQQDVPLIAELTVTSPLGEEIVISFDKAWHRAFELPRPVKISFNRFVRKD